MPSKDIAQGVRHLLMEAIPPPAPDSSAHQHSDPLRRERSTRLQPAFKATLTVMCVVVFFAGH